MKRILPVKVLLAVTVAQLSFNASQGQTIPPFNWANVAGGTGADAGVEIRMDGSNNIYTSGFFLGTAQFGTISVSPHPNTPSNGSYLAKQDASGNYQWVKAFPRYSALQSDAWKMPITVDGADNLIHTGRFLGTLDFDGTSLTASSTGGEYSVYIAKLSSTGTYTWAKMISDPGNPGSISTISDITTDNSGNIYLVGNFTGTVDFDPAGSGSAGILTATANSGFIVKLDANGDFVWAKAFLSSGTGSNSIFVDAIEIDNNGNVLTAGYFQIPTAGPTQYVDFDPGAGEVTLTPKGPDIGTHFVSKLNPDGDYVWARILGNNTGVTFTRWATSMAIDNSDGSVYATGYFNNTADLDPGPADLNFTAVGPNDAFIVKLDAAGDLAWAHTISGSGTATTQTDVIRGLALDGAGNVYMTGQFSATADLDPGPGVVTLAGSGSYNPFIAKWSSLGEYIDAQVFNDPGGNSSLGTGLLVNSAGTEITVMGNLGVALDLDYGPDVQSFNSAGSFDIFTLKLAPIVAPITLKDFAAHASNNKAELRWTTATESSNKGFAILRSTDSRNWTSIGYVSSKAANGNSSTDLDYQFIDHVPGTGINYYRLKQEDIDGKYSLSSIKAVSFSAQNELSIFPNPTPDYLYIKGVKGGETVTVHSTSGQHLGTYIVSKEGIYQLSLRGMAKGVYYIKVMAKEGSTKTFKVSFR